MSRIGKKPIELPAKVSVKIAADGAVNVEGPKGKLAWKLPAGVTGKVDGTKVSLAITNDHNKALFGLSRSLVNNMVKGVAEGYVKDLEIQGVGFKAAVKGKVLNLNLGYSHEINHPIPEGLKVTVAEDGRHALELLEQEHDRPEFVLTDFSMPRLDGMGLLEAVRGRWPRIRGAIMTGNPQESLASCDPGIPVIRKPIDPSELKRLLGDA